MTAPLKTVFVVAVALIDPDGRVLIPEVLQPYMRGATHIG